MKTVTVSLGERSYPIYIGTGLLNQRSLFKSHLPHQQVMIVTNETIAPLYLDRLLHTLEAYQTDYIILPDGEQYKTLTTLNQIFDALLAQRHDRVTTLCALGGGVVGDITGFAAACYRRGVAFIQIPTTLLAQVDSAIGGKTGVNHALGKNMIGAIYQPNSVMIDVDTLKTLPEREFRAGLAEVIKYGLITDAKFFSWLENKLPDILMRQTDALIEMIQHCCQIKANIVAADETEQGVRALLNLGHTFGHALESITAYKTFLHGEAVAFGIVLAANLSWRLGWLKQVEVERIHSLLHNAGLTIEPPSHLSAQMIWQLMTYDKKVKDKKLRLILLKALGEAVICEQFEPEKLQETLNQYFASSS